ncbi:MAG TPA: adenosylmethionine decarboxylase [Balneolaceae bacterium]|nr:adenosylmethionine decarboxylase [Balneolaceae bacterium]
MSEMEALGRQILVEMYNCDSKKINDITYVKSSLVKAVEASQATIISHDFHKFSPHGISGVVVIAESHVSIHTWPEYNYAALDVFTCGETIDPWVIQENMKIAVQATNTTSMEMKRGLFEAQNGEELPFKPLAKFRKE